MQVVEAADCICELLGVLGVQLEEAAETDYPAEVIELAADLAGYGGADAQEAVEALLEARALAKKDKDWPRADAIRDSLIALGFLIEDTPQGPKVTYQG